MRTINEVEKTFVETFVEATKRKRSLDQLASGSKDRNKFRNRLSHVFIEDLKAQFVWEKDQVPPEVAAQIKTVLSQWKKAHPEQLCHLITNSQRDGEMMSLGVAEGDFLLTTGAVIIIIPDKLAYYHTERSNLNWQPHYVLFRP